VASVIRRITILIVLGVFLLLGVALVALSYTEVGATREVVVDERVSVSAQFSDLPQSVVDDAMRVSNELYGGYQEKAADFIDQLLTTYVEAMEKDVVVVFNPGGWGWNELESSPGWQSICGGIETELDKLGYTSLTVSYQRTGETLSGIVDEFAELLVSYPSKAKNLAYRVEFLTDNVPDVTVIIAGESNGTLIADNTMNELGYNPQVYSIQTGTPFWHKTTVTDRTLVLNDNGIVPDTFSRGDLPMMAWASLKFSLGLSQPEDNGNILYYIRAPGHDYWWQYPNISTQVTGFLVDNLGIKSEEALIKGDLK